MSNKESYFWQCQPNMDGNLCNYTKTAVTMSYWQPFSRSRRSCSAAPENQGHPAVWKWGRVCVLPTSYQSHRSDSGGKRTSPVECGLARGWSCQHGVHHSLWLITSLTEPEVLWGGGVGVAVLGERNPIKAGSDCSLQDSPHLFKVLESISTNIPI